MSLGKLLKTARENNKVNTRIAARNIGISGSYLNDLENGNAFRPKMRFLYAMADYYAIDIDTLCIAAERIPRDVFYKIIKNPQLLNVIRNYEV